MLKSSKKGIVLFIVIGVIIVVGILSIVILRLISNQTRLTHHQLTRIQAQYAARAGMVYALDKLRRGDWTFPANCPDPVGCSVVDPDSAFPQSVRSIKVIFCPPNGACAGNICKPPAGANFCINTVVDYLYTP